MDVRLKPFDFAQAAARAGMANVAERVRQSAAAAGGAGAAGGPVSGSFQTSFSQALKQVSATQHQASELQRQVQLGNPTVSIEETMVAMQKAQIGFQATLQVRNKLVQAYTDIMNMQV
jgi:flagellar hook-basal body complex protein FliE